MGVYVSLESWVTRWRLSGLNFRSKKIMLIWDAERFPQAKFQLPKMLCSREIKSQKSPIICMGKWFRIDVFQCSCPVGSKLISHTNDRQFLGFYFSRTKHVWKLKFGLWGSFDIPNQHDFFDLKFRPERRHLVTQLPKLPYTPIKAPIGNLFLLVTFDPRRFKICRPGSEFYSPRPFQRGMARQFSWPLHTPYGRNIPFAENIFKMYNLASRWIFRPL